MRFSIVVVMILTAALTACGSQAGPSDSPRAERVADYFSPPKPFPGPAWARKGSPVDNDVLNSIAGPEHCHWQSAVLLHVGWPPGRPSRTASDIRQYVRDPEGVLDGDYRKALRHPARLPDDASDTGFRTGRLHLWLAPSDPDGAYLRVGNDIERWPRADPPLACA